MFRTVSILALVGSASAAAADYSNAEIDCTNAYNMVTCEKAYQETSCTDPLCVWNVDDADDKKCLLAAGNTTATAWTADVTAKNAAIGSAYSVCSASAEADCTGDCAWSAHESECTISVAKAEALLDADDANGGITAATMNGLFSGLTCSHLAGTAAACGAVDGCSVLTVGTDTGCIASDAKKISVIEAKCVTAGAAAQTAAEAAAGLSGATTAAPAMIILSTLVGALAIFA